jgi:hypothetical protein
MILTEGKNIGPSGKFKLRRACRMNLCIYRHPDNILLTTRKHVEPRLYNPHHLLLSAVRENNLGRVSSLDLWFANDTLILFVH